MSQNTDSPATVQVAQDKGVYAFGWDSDMQKFAPKAHLTANTNNWGVYYIQTIKDVMAGTWKPQEIKWGLKEGLVVMTPLNAAVSADAAKAFEAKKKAMIDGKFEPFQGPVKDQSGAIKVAAGKTMPLAGTDEHELVRRGGGRQRCPSRRLPSEMAGSATIGSDAGLAGIRSRSAEGRAAPAHRGHARAGDGVRARGASTASRCRYASVEALRAAYSFHDLQSFLDLYYAGASVLRDAERLLRADARVPRSARTPTASSTPRSSSIRRRTPTRGVAFEIVLDGICARAATGRDEARHHLRLILCFLRHLTEDDAMRHARAGAAVPDRFIAVGLDSSERAIRRRSSRACSRGRARQGLLTVAHAGEEGPPAYISRGARRC